MGASGSHLLNQPRATAYIVASGGVGVVFSIFLLIKLLGIK